MSDVMLAGSDIAHEFNTEPGAVHLLRNRIVWSFGHGLHSRQRFSGRYETVLWFTRPTTYYFDLDSVRVPQKYPGKRRFKGPRVGQYSGHPLGKNPGDVWVLCELRRSGP
jgi:adenine-specific DNA-methyltransferase